MKSKEIAQTAIFAALYYALGIVFQPISFGAIQIRVACSLIPLIALFGSPATIGITIGHLAFNMNSPLGVLDMISPIVFLIPRLLIQKYGIKTMIIHTLVVGLWVGYLLNTAFGLPMTLMQVQVGAGEFIAEWVLGLLLYQGVKSRL